MKEIIPILFLLVLSGCSEKPCLTNQQIVEETKFCLDNSTKAVPLMREFGTCTAHIMCSPKSE